MTSTLREPSWPDARRACLRGGVAAGAVGGSRWRTPLGTTLAVDLVAQHPLPPFDTAMMDGWAVCGPPPWSVSGHVLAGSTGAAARAGTGSRHRHRRPGARRSNGRGAPRVGDSTAGDALRPTGELEDRQDIRRSGDEASVGDRLVPAGTARARTGGRTWPPSAVTTRSLVHPAPGAGARARRRAAGPRAAHDGRVRDALGPQVLGWAQACDADGLDVQPRRPTRSTRPWLPLREATADVVLTTGGTARGPVDHMHAALEAVGASAGRGRGGSSAGPPDAPRRDS